MESTDTIIRSNMPFVTHVARRYRDRGVPLEDLVAEGTVGLIKAARRFDPDNGTRFTTYASFWIKKAIIEALLERPRVVHLPRYAREKGHPSRARSASTRRSGSRRASDVGRSIADGRARGALETIADREGAVLPAAPRARPFAPRAGRCSRIASASTAARRAR
jgi:RNA polymerase sigma factor (sigma-70 family)